MKQKDEEAKLDRMNTKQKRGTPTVMLKIIPHPKKKKFKIFVKSTFSRNLVSLFWQKFRESNIFTANNEELN